MIGGVASGLAHFFGLDPTIVRLVWLVSLFFGGAGFVLYIIAWIIIPPAPQGGATPTFAKSEQIREQVINTAKDIEAQLKGESTSRYSGEAERQAAQRRTVLGWILIGLGVLLLARNVFSWLAIGHLWPILIIIAGAVIIMQEVRK